MVSLVCMFVILIWITASIARTSAAAYNTKTATKAVLMARFASAKIPTVGYTGADISGNRRSIAIDAMEKSNLQRSPRVKCEFRFLTGNLVAVLSSQV
jgi:hypothetical protein